MRKSKKYLIWLVFIYSLIRVPLLLSPVGEFGSDGYLSDGGKSRGAIAAELLSGSKLPFWDYIDAPYAGGSLVAGLWTVPFFLIFGKTLFALKLVPFFLHLLSLVAWYFVFRKHFSEKQTFLMLLFVALPPPHITQFMLFNIGFHFETILWMALSILIFRRLLEGKLSEVKAGLYLGLLGGFSCFTDLSNLMTVALIWVYLAGVRLDTSRKLRFFCVYIPAFLIGFSPLIAHDWQRGWPAVDYMRDFLALDQASFLFFPQVFYGTIRHSLRIFLGFPYLPSVPRHLFMDGYTLFYLFSFVYLLWRKGKNIWKLGPQFDIEAFGLAFQILLFVLFLKRSATTAEYYFFPMVPFMGMTLVLAAASLGRLAQKGLLIFCVSAGVLGNISAIPFHQLGLTLSLPGYSYDQLDLILKGKFEQTPSILFDKYKKVARGKSISIKKTLYQRIPVSCFALKTADDIKTFATFINKEELELQPILFEKLGWQLGGYTHFDRDKLNTLLQNLDIDQTSYPVIWHGAVQALQGHNQTFWEMIDKGIAFCKAAPISMKRACYEGLGLLEDPKFAMDDKLILHESILSKVERDYREYYYKGVGEYAFFAFDPASRLTKSFFNSLKDPEKQWFLEGLARYVSNEGDFYIQTELKQHLAELTQ